MGGLNFAFGAGLAYYHTPEDTPENLDQRTLQHQGENALATARHFGRLDLDKTDDDDVVYTSVLNRFVVSYSKMWALPLALVAACGFLALAMACDPKERDATDRPARRQRDLPLRASSPRCSPSVRSSRWVIAAR